MHRPRLTRATLTRDRSFNESSRDPRYQLGIGGGTRNDDQRAKANRVPTATVRKRTAISFFRATSHQLWRPKRSRPTILTTAKRDRARDRAMKVQGVFGLT